MQTNFQMSTWVRQIESLALLLERSKRVAHQDPAQFVEVAEVS